MTDPAPEVDRLHVLRERLRSRLERQLGRAIDDEELDELRTQGVRLVLALTAHKRQED